MKKQFLAASALLVLTSGAALATTITPLDTTDAIQDALLGDTETAMSSQEFSPNVVSPVPLPAAGWMLLAGLGGIVALRRRAKA